MVRDPRFDKLMAFFKGSDEKAWGAMRDGWSKTGDLITTGTQEPSGKYAMQADFSHERGGSGAQYYTMKFGVPHPAPSCQARAEIKWKAQGTDVRRLIDVGNGTSISGTAQAASVEVFDVTTPFKQDLATPNPFLGQRYRVDTLITPGVRPNMQQPPRLTPLFTDWLTSGGAQYPDVWVSGAGITLWADNTGTGFPDAFVRVPQNTGVISFYYQAAARVQATLVPAQLADLDGVVEPMFIHAGTAFSTGTFPIFAGQGAWIPIPAFVNFIAWHNVTATSGPTKKLIDISDFAFGIEG